MSRTPMKLILTQEVTGLGAPGDVVEVAGGYGRNYLVPRGLAMRWTRGAEKQVDLIKRARSARDIRGLDDAKQTAGRLGALKVRLATKAGNTGRLFGSVSPSDIADAVRAAGGTVEPGRLARDGRSGGRRAEGSAALGAVGRAARQRGAAARPRRTARVAAAVADQDHRGHDLHVIRSAQVPAQ